MKKRTLKKIVPFGILFFGISLLLWNCEKEEIEFNQPNNLNFAISNQFDSDNFKALLPHKFTINWSDTEKQFSEDLNANFYEFSLIYRIKHFNPITINKISPRKYYHKYKLIAIEKEKEKYEFYLAKFFQEKDSRNPDLENSTVTLNQNTGYNGLMQLYNTKGKLTFSKYIYSDENSNYKASKNKKETKTVALNKTNNLSCITITTYHYRDWYQNVYDAYGNFLGTVYVYTELIGTTTREECDPTFAEPDYVNAVAICQGTCFGHLTEELFCPNGDPVDENGNCDGYGENLEGNDAPSPEELLQAQQDYLNDQLSLERNSAEMNWVYDDLNNEAIEQLYNYLLMFDIDGNITPSISGFVMQVISAWIETNNTADIDFYNQIINNELTGKEKCLNDHLENLGNDFVRNLLGNFEGDGSEYSINIESKNNVYTTNSNGNTTEVNAKTIYTSNSNVIRIEISGSKAISNRALQVTRTLLHEYIHADIFRKLYTSNPTSDDLEFRETFNSYENNNFEPSPSHQTMADLYVYNMKNALKSFHQTVMLGDYNYLSDNGQISLDNFYEALAWQGLKNHGVQAWIDLSQERKDEIDQSYVQYIFSTTHNCP